MRSPSAAIPGSVRPWVPGLVKLGYLAKGLIYLLIGTLAMGVALGLRGGRLTDPADVLITLLRQPFGRVLLAIIGFGILGYTAYYLFEAIADLRRRGGGLRGWSSRVLTMIKAVAYGAIGVQALDIVFFDARPRASAESSARQVMRFPLGDVALVVIGLGIAVYGCSQLKLSWDGKDDDDIDVDRMRREAAWIVPLGRLGTAARSIILVLMGIGLLWSGLQERPSNADGYKDVLATVASINPWVLAVMGGGLGCFGFYQLCHARYAKIAVR